MKTFRNVFIIAFTVFFATFLFASISDPAGTAGGSLSDKSGLQIKNPISGASKPMKPFVPSRKLAALESEPESDIKTDEHIATEANAESFDTVAKQVDNPKPLNMGFGVQEFSIIVSSNGYFPKKIYVRRNIPLKLYLTSSSETTLCVISDELGIKKGVKNLEVQEIYFVPKKEGVFQISCPILNNLKGEIIVRD